MKKFSIVSLAFGLGLMIVGLLPWFFRFLAVQSRSSAEPMGPTTAFLIDRWFHGVYFIIGVVAVIVGLCLMFHKKS